MSVVTISLMGDFAIRSNALTRVAESGVALEVCPVSNVALGVYSDLTSVPLPALIMHATLAWLLALVGNFDTLALISGGAICLVYGLVSAAAWRAQRRDLRERGTPFVLPGGVAIPLLAVVAMMLIVATLSAQEWSAIGIALVVLVAVYGGLHGLRRRRA